MQKTKKIHQFLTKKHKFEKNSQSLWQCANKKSYIFLRFAMATINGVLAETIGAKKPETKTPTMAEVLSRMEANFEESQAQIANAQSAKTYKNVQIQGEKNGQNDILTAILPLLAKSNSQEEIKQKLIAKLLESSGNPMLAQLLTILPKLKKNQNGQKPPSDSPKQTESEETKIDQFVKTDDYAQNKFENTII